MTSRQWEEVKERFHEALQKTGEARQAYLIQECSEDAVRIEVERLLTEYSQAGDFLGRPAIEPSDSFVAGLFEPFEKIRTGQTLDRYQILSVLGSGGMGMVYQAHDPLLGRKVALKLLPQKFTSDEAALRRFRGEGRALSALNHPNICTVHDIGEEKGCTFIVMEHISGKRLDEIICRQPMQPDEVMKYALQIAAGLEKAHAAEIIHRDLKPGNIMVTDDGVVKLLDFGVAKLIPAAPLNSSGRNESELTLEGMIIGTPAYMSPEQAETKTVDARSDIFSFGAVLYEMITGQRAFRGESPVATLSAILHTEPERLADICPSVPLELDRIVARCLCKKPEERFQTAAALRAALQQIELETGRRESARPIGASRKARVLAMGISAFLLIAGAWVIIGTSGMRQSGQDLPGEKRIAILPLDVVGADESVRALADGLVETLTSKLSEIEEFQGILMVVPASELRSRKITSAQAARRVYNANLVITGSAQRWSDRIQFTLNLVETAGVRQVGSRTFEFDAANPIKLRDEAVNGTVELLALKLTPGTLGFIAEGETSSQGANAEFLKGSGYLSRYDLTGNTDRAIQSLTQATRLDPHYALAFAELGQAHWLKAKTKSDAREKELALESIREAILLDPNLAKAHVRLGEIYAQTGQITGAVQQEQTALRTTPGDAEAYMILGEAYTSEGQFNQAEAAYLEAIRRKPGDWLAHLNLAIFYENRGRNTAARSQFEAARNITPDNEVVYRNLAGLEMLEAKFHDASDSLVKSLRFEKNARTYSALGAAYYYQRRYTEAADALHAGIGLDGNRSSIWGNLGTVDRHLPGRGEEAREAFRKAIELAQKTLEVIPSDAQTHANLAEYWAKLDDKTRALNQIELIPAGVRSAFADSLVLVYELTGNRARAIQVVQALPESDPLLLVIRNDPDLDALWLDPALQPR